MTDEEKLWWQKPLDIWECIDRRTGELATSNVFFSEVQVWRQIAEWQDRHDRGKRPDITREFLLNLRPRLKRGISNE